MCEQNHIFRQNDQHTQKFHRGPPKSFLAKYSVSNRTKSFFWVSGPRQAKHLLASTSKTSRAKSTFFSAEKRMHEETNIMKHKFIYKS